MRLPILIAGALALALQVACIALAVMLPTPPAFAAEPAQCKFRMDETVQELTAAKYQIAVLDGEMKDEFLKALAASITLQTGQPAPDMSGITRVLLVEIQGDMFFGLETADGCLSDPLPMAPFFPPVNRSGRDALGTHS